MTKKKFKKIKGRKLSSRELQTAIMKLFGRFAPKKFNAKQIIKKLKILNSKPSVTVAMEKLAEKGKLKMIDEYTFALNRQGKADDSPSTREGDNKAKDQQVVEGKVDMIRSGAAYILVDELDDDVFVSNRRINGAMNGDTVVVRVFYPRGRNKPEGEVIKVLNRAVDHFIGKVEMGRKYAIIKTSTKHGELDIFVDFDKLKGAKKNETVVVKVTQWPKRHKHQPIGVVTSVLGLAGGSDIEMKSILINNGFELEFPDKVVQQANELYAAITPAEIAERRDMREVTTFTIDPDTAKDFDDALSYEELENGNIEIGVHIADVSHYVQEGTALDKEAFKRSTSVYLVDRVLPMLPEKLSNELCSLRPHEDKCTFSAVFTFDKKHKIIDRWFGKTVTHSDRRFTYEEAQQVIETQTGDFAEEILLMNTIAKKLRKQKFKNGAISFESEEVKFRLDEEGTPLDVYVKERKEAHMLIEDFMLLANKEVAIFIHKKAAGQEIPFVYRIHDEPNPERVADFGLFAKEMGVKIDVQDPKAIVASFNNLAKMARKDPALRILEPLAIRTMAKAVYSTENIGHFGLGFEFYSHFTSPIRRYSDVLTHRILEKNLVEKKSYRANKETLEDKCKHISAMERKAMTAERESIKYKQVEYIEKHIGEAFDGVVSGIIERGLFVELVANKCEGMVSFDEIGENFTVEESRLKATGKKSGQVFRMGDKIKVIVQSADLQKRQIELQFVPSEQ